MFQERTRGGAEPLADDTLEKYPGTDLKLTLQRYYCGSSREARDQVEKDSYSPSGGAGIGGTDITTNRGERATRRAALIQEKKGILNFLTQGCRSAVKKLQRGAFKTNQGA